MSRQQCGVLTTFTPDTLRFSIDNYHNNRHDFYHTYSTHVVEDKHNNVLGLWFYKK